MAHHGGGLKVTVPVSMPPTWDRDVPAKQIDMKVKKGWLLWTGGAVV